MPASEPRALPPELLRARSRFQTWREHHKSRSRIPQSLWQLAVRLANTHGISRTATALRLDYYCLKKKVDATSAQPPATSPAFVELPAPVLLGKQCLVELAGQAGASLRLQLLGYDVDDLARLVRHLGSVE